MASMYVICQNCGTTNEPRSIFCANCGTPLQANGSATFGPLQERPSSPVFSGNNMPSSPSSQTGGASIPPPPYLGGNVPSSSPNYQNDGQFYQPSPYPTNNTPPPTPPPARSKSKIGLLLIVVALVIVLISGAVLASALLIKPNPNTGATATNTPTTATTPNATTTTTVQATDTPVPTDTATGATTPASTATSSIPTQTALPCTVNVGAWTDGSSDWKVLNGTVLLNDGSNSNNPNGGYPSIVAPCQPATTANYAVETKIQVVSGTSGCFGITVRGNPLTSGWQGYMVGVGGCGYNGLNTAYIGGPNYSNESSSVQASFSPGTSVHTYRVEAKNNTIKFFVDNSLLLTLTDNRFLTGAQIGLWDQSIQLQITSFQVTAL